MTNEIWTGGVAYDGQDRIWQFEAETCLGTAADGQSPEIWVAAGGETPVPAKALPESGLLSDLSQKHPRGLLPAPVRLAVAGWLRTAPNWDGTVCLITQDRSHWAQISADEVVSFQSFLTPGLFYSLSSELSGAAAEAVADSLSRPARLATQLSSADLTGDRDALAGHLIGAELAATKAFWLGLPVVVIAEDNWGTAYAQALATQAVSAEQQTSSDMLQQGLIALRQSTLPEAG